MERKSRFPFAHTYSIIAHDPESGLMGVAVQSHWFSVGSLVTWAEAGVGVVATQSMVEVTYGPLGLSLMRAGKTASQALKALKQTDEGAPLRQVAMLDIHGNVATHTGDRCIAAAGHRTGERFSVQANMMLNDTVWPAMADAYQQADLPFAERLVAALSAGQKAGGDIRGKQSAAILIVKDKATGKPWDDKVLELRVEDHPEPVQEISRLLNMHSAYEFMNQGDALLSEGHTEKALYAYKQAAVLAPGLLELPFWQAVTMAEIGNVDEALVIFKRVFDEENNWRELLRRLPTAGLFNASEETLGKILDL